VHPQQQLGRALRPAATQLAGQFVRLPDAVRPRRIEAEAAHVVQLRATTIHSRRHARRPIRDATVAATIAIPVARGAIAAETVAAVVAATTA